VLRLGLSLKKPLILSQNRLYFTIIGQMLPSLHAKTLGSLLFS
jgi:hypothetical protein